MYVFFFNYKYVRIGVLGPTFLQYSIELESMSTLKLGVGLNLSLPPTAVFADFSDSVSSFVK